MLVSARGSAKRQRPAPNAPAAASREKPNARDPDGISSAATMPTSTPPAVAAPRTNICVTPSDTRSGASADRRGQDAAGRRAAEQDPPPPAPVGQCRHQQGTQHADAHQRQDRALICLAGVELIGGEGDRLGQQRADEPEDDGEVAQRPQRRAATAVGCLGGRPPGRVTRRRTPPEGHPVRGAEQPRPHHRRQLVPDGLGDLALVAHLDRALVLAERTRPRREATVVDEHLGHQVVAGLAGDGVLIGREHPDEDAHSSSSASAFALGLPAGGPPVGDREEPAEQRDRHQDEEQLVPPALVGGHPCCRAGHSTSVPAMLM